MTRGIGRWRRRGNGARRAGRTRLKKDEYPFRVAGEVDTFRMADNYVSEALVLAVQGEQRVLRTEAAVHVPERIMRQSASRIAHECFRLNYQIPLALACRRSNVDAA
jgi:hypothetical protein